MLSLVFLFGLVLLGAGRSVPGRGFDTVEGYGSLRQAQGRRARTGLPFSDMAFLYILQSRSSGRSCAGPHERLATPAVPASA
jgi:hypothetical protein